MTDRINRDYVCRLCTQFDPAVRLLSIKKYKPIMEKLANIKLCEDLALTQKICEPCAQLLKAAEVLQTNIIETNKAWEEMLTNKRHLNPNQLMKLQTTIEKAATRLYDNFESDDDEYQELVVQRVEVFEDFQNCGICITPYNRLPASSENLQLEENYPHRLCFDCIENLEKTLCVVKNCRKVNLKSWRVTQCILCRSDKNDGVSSASKKLRDFAIIWNDQTSAEKIALSTSRICFDCQHRLTDAMKFRYHILKIEEALFPETAHGVSKWGGNQNVDRRCRMYTFIKQVNVVLNPNAASVQPYEEQYEASAVEYDHEFDFEWNKIPVNYDSDQSEMDFEDIQLNQPFHQNFIKCPECHKQIHELDFDTHKESHTWTGTTCPYCSENMLKHSLFNHIMRKHKNYKGYVCHICGLALFSEQCGITHFKRMHPNAEFSCPHCPKKFKLQKYLDSHVRVHLNTQPYRCRYCDKKFNGWSDRRWHEMSHTGNYKHFCSYCKKGFTKPRLVRLHEKQCKQKRNIDSD